MELLEHVILKDFFQFYEILMAIYRVSYQQHNVYALVAFLMMFLIQSFLFVDSISLAWIMVVIPCIEMVFISLIIIYEHEYIKAKMSIFKPQFIEFRSI
jgi:hypothetical protein